MTAPVAWRATLQEEPAGWRQLHGDTAGKSGHPIPRVLRLGGRDGASCRCRRRRCRRLRRTRSPRRRRARAYRAGPESSPCPHVSRGEGVHRGATRRRRASCCTPSIEAPRCRAGQSSSRDGSSPPLTRHRAWRRPVRLHRAWRSADAWMGVRSRSATDRCRLKPCRFRRIISVPISAADAQRIRRQRPCDRPSAGAHRSAHQAGVDGHRDDSRHRRTRRRGDRREPSRRVDLWRRRSVERNSGVDRTGAHARRAHADPGGGRNARSSLPAGMPRSSR